jgi:hypothetical protein
MTSPYVLRFEPPSPQDLDSISQAACTHTAGDAINLGALQYDVDVDGDPPCVLTPNADDMRAPLTVRYAPVCAFDVSYEGPADAAEARRMRADEYSWDDTVYHSLFTYTILRRQDDNENSAVVFAQSSSNEALNAQVNVRLVNWLMLSDGSTSASAPLHATHFERPLSDGATGAAVAIDALLSTVLDRQTPALLEQLPPGYIVGGRLYFEVQLMSSHSALLHTVGTHSTVPLFVDVRDWTPPPAPARQLLGVAWTLFIVFALLALLVCFLVIWWRRRRAEQRKVAYEQHLMRLRKQALGIE